MLEALRLQLLSLQLAKSRVQSFMVADVEDSGQQRFAGTLAGVNVASQEVANRPTSWMDGLARPSSSLRRVMLASSPSLVPSPFSLHLAEFAPAEIDLDEVVCPECLKAI